jgi:hypothetical protein
MVEVVVVVAAAAAVILVVSFICSGIVNNDSHQIRCQIIYKTKI